VLDLEITNPNFIKQLLNEINIISLDREFIMEKISPWLAEVENGKLSKMEKQQKIKEIIDLGNFLFYYDKSIEIFEDITENPDFIIKRNSELIGIELKDFVISKPSKEREGVIRTILSDVESILYSENTNNNGLYRVDFYNHNFPLRKPDKENIKKEILSMIKGEAVKTTYIARLKKSPSARLHIYAGGSTCSGPLSKSQVIEQITSKEKRINGYKNKAKFNELWLLLTLGGVEQSSAYSDFEPDILTNKFVSNFDKIFIFDFFKGEIIELKVINQSKE